MKDTAPMFHVQDMPGCRGLCSQGRKLCVCPEACQLSELEEHRRMTYASWRRADACIAVIFVAVVAALIFGWL